MLNRIAIYCCLPFLVVAAVVFALPTVAQAAAVDVTNVAIGLADVITPLVQVAGAGLLIWALVGSFQALRELIGAGTAKTSPVSTREFQRQAYLASLAAQLEQENAVAAHHAAGDLTPTYRPATIEEQASWDRLGDKREQYANEAAKAAMDAYEWQTDSDGAQYRMHTIKVMGNDKSFRLDYADEFNQAREEALETYDRGGVSNDQLMLEKEDRKDLDMQAMREH